MESKKSPPVVANKNHSAEGKKRGDHEIAERRDLICELIAELHGKNISLDDLKQRLADRGYGVTPPTLRKDLNELSDGGAPFHLRHGTILSQPRAMTEFDKRRAHQKEEKAEIAAVASALLFGDEPTKQSIPRILEKSSAYRHGFKVIEVLREMWGRPHRVASMDAGSTGEAIARAISARVLSGKATARLSIVTNAPPILEALYRTGEIQTIIVGGELRHERYSIVGHLAERSLDAFDLVPDISFIGATGIDIQRGFASDNIMETQIKVRLLRSRIRCVVMDHTKVKHPTGAFSIFSPLQSDHVDFVMMDSKIHDENRLFTRFRERLVEAKICLLTPITLGFHKNSKRPAKP